MRVWRTRRSRLAASGSWRRRPTCSDRWPWPRRRIRIENVDHRGPDRDRRAVGRTRIEELGGPSSPTKVRVLAVAALARLDVDAAAARAVELIPKAAARRG